MLIYYDQRSELIPFIYFYYITYTKLSDIRYKFVLLKQHFMYEV